MAIVVHGGKGCSDSGAGIDNCRFQVQTFLFPYCIVCNNYEQFYSYSHNIFTNYFFGGAKKRLIETILKGMVLHRGKQSNQNCPGWLFTTRFLCQDFMSSIIQLYNSHLLKKKLKVHSSTGVILHRGQGIRTEGIKKEIWKI